MSETVRSDHLHGPMDGPAGGSVDGPAGGSVDGSGAPRRTTWTVSVVTLSMALVAVCLAVGLAATVSPRVLIPGLPDAGRLVEFAAPGVRALFDLTAALTVGWLLAAVVLVPPHEEGRLDVGGYRSVRAAALAAGVWAAAALALVPLTYADTYGGSLLDALSADTVIQGISVSDAIRGYLIAGVLAALIAVLAPVVLRRPWAGCLLLMALIGVLPQAVGGHAAQSGDHDVAVDTMIYHLVGVSIWVGGLVALLGLVRQRVAHLDVISRRYSATALVAFVVVALSGLINAWVRLASVNDLWLTDYGRLVLAKAVLLVLLGVFGWEHRARTLRTLGDGSDRRPFLRLALVEVLIMAATLGIAVALGRTASPPTSAVVPSDIELLLGFDISGPPNLGRVLLDWRMDWLLGPAVVAAAVIYLLGVRRLRRRGDRWSRGRTAAWLGGCALVLIATSSGLGRYAEAQFSIHMIAHMLLGMMAPILLVLGGPTTLALRALPAAPRGGVPGLREAVVAGVHSPVTRFVTHPLIVFALFVGSFFAVYFTPVFDAMIGSHLGHLVMNVHFLAVGYLYYWVIIGVDPTPRRLQPLVKLGLLLGALPFHAFFGLALMNSHTAMATGYYTGLVPWNTDLVADQRLGGAIAWGATEIPIIIVVIALLAQWAKSDEREAARSDRTTDRGSDEELDAYNAMLAGLAEQQRVRQPDAVPPSLPGGR